MAGWKKVASSTESKRSSAAALFVHVLGAGKGAGRRGTCGRITISVAIATVDYRILDRWVVLVFRDSRRVGRALARKSLGVGVIGDEK